MSNFFRNIKKRGNSSSPPAGGNWVPTDGTHNVLFWGNANNVVTSGSEVTQLTDLGGSNNHFSPGGTGPTLETIAELPGKNVMTFNGNALGGPGELLTAKNWMYFITVARDDGNTNNNDYFMGVSLDANFEYGYIGTNGMKFGGNQGATFPSGTTFSSKTFELHSGTIDSNGGLTFINAAQVGSYSAGVGQLASPSGTTYIGAGRDSGRALIGSIFEVVIIEVPAGGLSTADREYYEGYMAWEAGLEALLPGGHTYKSARPQTAGGTPDTTAPSQPGTPSLDSATDNTLLISWTASTDNVAVTAYEVYVDSAFFATVTTASATIDGLTPGTSYDVHIIAKDAAGNPSAASATASLSTTGTADGTAPSQPGTPSLDSSSDTQITFSWAASTDNIAVTGYQVWIDGVLDTTVAGTSHTKTGLTASTSYAIYIIAEDAAGNESTQSATANLSTTAGSGDVTAPQNLELFGLGRNDVLLFWGDATANTGTLQPYEVFVNSVSQGTTAGNTFHVSGLTKNTAYNIEVRASNDLGATNSSTLTPTTLDDVNLTWDDNNDWRTELTTDFTIPIGPSPKFDGGSPVNIDSLITVNDGGTFVDLGSSTTATAINNAISAASGPTVIQLPSGNTTIDSMIDMLNVSQITLQGHPDGTSVLIPSFSSGYGINVQGNPNFQGSALNITSDLGDQETVITVDSDPVANGWGVGDTLTIEAYTYSPTYSPANSTSHDGTSLDSMRILCKISAISGNDVTIDRKMGIPKELSYRNGTAGEFKRAWRINPGFNNCLKNFKIDWTNVNGQAPEYDNGSAPFENINGNSNESHSSIRFLANVEFAVQDVEVINGNTTGLLIKNSRDVLIDGFYTNGVQNRGGGGAGYGAQVYAGWHTIKVRRWRDRLCRHSFAFSQTQAGAFLDAVIESSTANFELSHGSAERYISIVNFFNERYSDYNLDSEDWRSPDFRNIYTLHYGSATQSHYLQANGRGDYIRAYPNAVSWLDEGGDRGTTDASIGTAEGPHNFTILDVFNSDDGCILISAPNNTYRLWKSDFGRSRSFVMVDGNGSDRAWLTQTLDSGEEDKIFIPTGLNGVINSASDVTITTDRGCTKFDLGAGNEFLVYEQFASLNSSDRLKVVDKSLLDNIHTMRGWTDMFDNNAPHINTCGLSARGTYSSGNLTFKFNENIQFGSGTTPIQIRERFGNAVAHTFTNNTDATISGDTLTLSGIPALTSGTEYYVYIGTDVIQGVSSGVSFWGLTAYGLDQAYTNGIYTDAAGKFFVQYPMYNFYAA